MLGTPDRMRAGAGACTEASDPRSRRMFTRGRPGGRVRLSRRPRPLQRDGCHAWPRRPIVVVDLGRDGSSECGPGTDTGGRRRYRTLEGPTGGQHARQGCLGDRAQSSVAARGMSQKGAYRPYGCRHGTPAIDVKRTFRLRSGVGLPGMALGTFAPDFCTVKPLISWTAGLRCKILADRAKPSWVGREAARGASGGGI